MERTAILYDCHAPYHDPGAYEIALEYIKNLKPKINRLILGGDYVDFYKISFFKSDPERMSFEDEVNIVSDMLKDLRQRFYRVPIDYIEGNHEARMFNHLRDKAPELIFRNKIEDVLALKQRNIRYTSNIQRMCLGQQPYKLGKLNVLHGHEGRISFGAINLARLWHSKTHMNVIVGHHHRTDKALIKKLDGSYEGAWSVGTLGKLSESYMPLNNWVHGFAYVDNWDDGYFEVHNKIIIDGKVIEF